MPDSGVRAIDRQDKALQILQRLPGVAVDRAFAAVLQRGGDLARARPAAPRKQINALLALDFDGLHLMNFGMPLVADIDLMQGIRS